jgi:hypothetical protein
MRVALAAGEPRFCHRSRHTREDLSSNERRDPGHSSRSMRGVSTPSAPARASRSYVCERRRPESTTLLRVVPENLATLNAAVEKGFACVTGCAGSTVPLRRERPRWLGGARQPYFRREQNSAKRTPPSRPKSRRSMKWARAFGPRHQREFGPQDRGCDVFASTQPRPRAHEVQRALPGGLEEIVANSVVLRFKESETGP